jgi:hypothetical protein
MPLPQGTKCVKRAYCRAQERGEGRNDRDYCLLKYTSDLLRISIIEAPRIIEAERINCRVEVQRVCRIHSYSLGPLSLGNETVANK